MNLIEKFGGYDAAKEWCKDQDLRGGHTVKIRAALLEYRRQHNIFEVGDKVVLVYFDCHATNVYTVLSNKEFLILNNGERYSFGIIRHATDEEIAAGRRL